LNPAGVTTSKKLNVYTLSFLNYSKIQFLIFNFVIELWMAKWTHFYLIRIEFLGFRYHGWQKQAVLKSVQGMIDKTFSFIFQHDKFRTLGCGRTDAKVSADDYVLELFTFEDIPLTELLSELNKNLPADIRAKSVEKTDASFNIIQHPKLKEYHYSFSFGPKSHPFNAPHICDLGENLDIEKMMSAAKLFEGTHNFKRFTSKQSENKVFEREIISSEIVANDKAVSMHAPENTYIFKVKSKGFLTYQVRLMMGALEEIGKGTFSIEDLKEALEKFDGQPIKNIAPSSGLNLHKVTF
jgi:tRNA pseudouridine38-40 synthase